MISHLCIGLLLILTITLNAGEDSSPTVLFMISEPEYQTEITLAEIAGLRCSLRCAD
jgi:hypothetical protein